MYDLYQTYQSSRFSPGERKRAKETRVEKNCTSSPVIKYRRSRRRSRREGEDEEIATTKKDKKPCGIGSAGREGGEEDAGGGEGEKARKRKEGMVIGRPAPLSSAG